MLRAPTALCLAVLLRTAAAQEIRINEVLCAHAWDATDRADRIELYNAGRTAVDLNGFTIALNGATHRIEGALMIPAHGFRVLFCDHHPERGNDHLDLKLPRGGGSVLLIAPDRTRMLDLFTWPALPAGVSMGRVPDGARNWAFFEQPTFGSANNAASARKRLLRAPILQVEGSAVLLTAEEGCTTRYTTDGTSPDVRSARYATALTLHNGEVLRARAFADDGIPSTEVVHTALLPPAAIALTIEPFQLDDPKQGLFANENYARKGREWERPALVEWPLANEARPMMHVGVAVSGSGTRSAPKKNLKLFARDRFGSESVLPFAEGSDELILRADATPHALLRNLFLERIALRSGRRVDVQPSTVLPLYVNGACFGAYRAMPAKNAAWVKRMGKAEAVDLIDGPGGHAIAGDDVRFRQMLGLLQRGAPIDSLEQLIDVNSLIELACFDLWTGRADHDLNVRCWRPRTADGRFRWILYDMDLWAATDDPTVDRMAQATTLEAPYLDQLLAHPDLRDRLLQRMSTLVATTLAPEQAAALADSLYRTHAELMRTDHERWKDTLSMPAPWEGLADLQAHVQGRAPRILDQLARHTGTDVRTITVQVEPRGAGTITLDGLAMGGNTLNGFTGVPLTLSALPGPGMEFVGWKNGDGPSPMLTVVPGRTKSVRAVFRPAGVSRRNGL